MASLAMQWRKGHQIYHEKGNYARWLDALGPDVKKYINNGVSLPSDDTTGDPTEFTTTVVEVGAGDSTVALVDGALLFTSAANENDGIQIQLKGEAFDLASGNLLYFGVKLKVNDADQTDLIAGLCITDTTLLGGMTDGIYFRSVDGAAALTFVLEKDSTETESSTIHTLVDDTYVTLEFFFDGTNVDVYIDQVVQTRLAVTNLPDNEQLTLSLAFLTGEAVANTMTVDWVRVIQIDA